MYYSELVKKACVLMFEAHKNDLDKGGYPYVFHPFYLTTQMEDEASTCVALLHDVIEDTDTDINQLMVSESAREAIVLLSKTESYNNADYYNGIKDNKIALLVKVIDRCNNVSHMASGFKENKIRQYIAETEEYVYPLIKYGQDMYPDHSGNLFVLKYHIKSVIESLKRFL